jgi:16S rRNA U516 pseudouridylate synthase RsuA-like enzyme
MHMPLTRLDKLLTDRRPFSRSEAKLLIRAGRVTVNGAGPRRPEEKFDASRDVICADGRTLSCVPARCLMLQKPAGVSPRRRTRGRRLCWICSRPRCAGRAISGRETGQGHDGLLLLTKTAISRTASRTRGSTCRRSTARRWTGS